jgi:hypothetical protein
MFSDAQIYEFSSFVEQEVLSFVESTSGNLIVFIVVIAYLIFVIVPLGCTRRRSDGDAAEHFNRLVYERSMKIASELFSSRSDQSLLFVRFARAVRHNHDYFVGLKGLCNSCFATNTAERLQLWIVLIGYFLNIMILQTGCAWLAYPDDDYCSGFLSEFECTEIYSVLMVTSRCAWDIEDVSCKLKSPLSSSRDIYVLVGFTCLASFPLNLLWKLAVPHLFSAIYGFESAQDDTISGGGVGFDRNSSLKSNYGSPANDNKLPIQKQQSRVDFFKASSTEIADGAIPRGQGSIEEEVKYILAEAKAVMDQTESESFVLSVGSVRRQRLRESLQLSKQGRILEHDLRWSRYGCGRCAASPLETLRDKLIRVRNEASNILSYMAQSPEKDLKVIVLLEEFMLRCLPDALKDFALGRLFKIEGSSLRPNWLVVCASVLYFLVALLVVVMFGLNWFGQITTKTWAIMIALSVAFDCFVVAMLRVFFKYIFMSEYVISYLQQIQLHFKRRISLILVRMRNDLTSPGLELVQHLNAGCRAARHAGLSSSEAAEALLWVTDGDVPQNLQSRESDVFDQADVNALILSGNMLGLFFLRLYELMQSIVPRWFLHLVLEMSLYGFAVLLLVAVYFLNSIHIAVTIVIFGLILSVCALYDWMLREEFRELDRVSRRAVSNVSSARLSSRGAVGFAASEILRRAAPWSSSNRSNNWNRLGEAELEVIRDDLLSATEKEIAALESGENPSLSVYLGLSAKPGAPTLLKKPSQQEPEPLQQQRRVFKVAPVASASMSDSDDSAEGPAARNSENADRLQNSAQTTPSGEISRQSKIGQNPARGASSIHAAAVLVATLKSSSNSAKRQVIALAPQRPADAIESSSPQRTQQLLQREKVQIGAQDYKVLSTSIATYLRNQVCSL